MFSTRSILVYRGREQLVGVLEIVWVGNRQEGP